jgi:predicted amidohydrolase YtcJ
MQNSKILISGGRIFTADPDRLWGEAILIDGGKV